MSRRKHLIIGAGVAGVAAACRLVERGEKPLLIDASPFPTHKICGEFFSPECVEWLNRWGVTFDKKIDRIAFKTLASSWEIPLKTAAGTKSHLTFDKELLDFALKGGAEFLPSSKVGEIQRSSEHYLVTLQNGPTFEAENLFIASGRLPFFNNPPAKPSYRGQKAYFKGLKLKDPLVMLSLPGSYLGISEVENGVFNVALLSKHPSLMTLEDLKNRGPEIEEIFKEAEMLFPEWQTGTIPSFGFKKTPELKNCTFIGDAAMTIPPASGCGLSISIASGVMAVDFSLKGEGHLFKGSWKDQHKKQVRAAILLHHLLLRPRAVKLAQKLLEIFPSIANYFFEITREPNFSLFSKSGSCFDCYNEII